MARNAGKPERSSELKETLESASVDYEELKPLGQECYVNFFL